MPSQPILLIDDNHDDLFILKRLLVRAGVKHGFVSFDHASDCVGFLENALQAPGPHLMPVAVFTDKSMPEVDGFELLSWIRKQPPLAQLPVVMLSSVVDPRDAQRAQSLGATAFLEKFPAPHVFAELLRSAG